MPGCAMRKAGRHWVARAATIRRPSPPIFARSSGAPQPRRSATCFRRRSAPASGWTPISCCRCRKALRLPRVNLLIADDVGLGKTVEAGLVLRELLLRRRVDFALVLAPAAMTVQWQDELATKFGLAFEIVDRRHLEDLRRQRGYGANPWAAGARFILSHTLVGDEAYVAGLRDVLEDFRARSLLILDEAHHAAPSGGGRYAVESQFTRELRDLAGRFEHRLFLSATPHNGHANSFATLLEAARSAAIHARRSGEARGPGAGDGAPAEGRPARARRGVSRADGCAGRDRRPAARCARAETGGDAGRLSGAPRAADRRTGAVQGGAGAAGVRRDCSSGCCRRWRRSRGRSGCTSPRSTG